jgi:hypothetical protein
LGRHTEQTIATYRARSKSLFGISVKARCPLCEKKHVVKVGRKPTMMLRIFCPECRPFVEKE